MKKNVTTQLLNIVMVGVTILGMVLSNKVQEREMKELKEELRLELKNEKEK